MDPDVRTRVYQQGSCDTAFDLLCFVPLSGENILSSMFRTADFGEKVIGRYSPIVSN